MAYAILRIQKTKKHSVASKNHHNMRLGNTANADDSRKQDNQVLIGCGNLKVDLKKRIDETEATVRNKETVVLQELVLTASKEYFLDSKNEFKKEKVEAWTKKQEEYLQEKFGKNCVNAVLHLDEETPHIHAFVTPIVYNEKKNRNEFNNKNYFLSDYKRAQDEYYNHNKSLGLERGKEAEITGERNLPLRDYNRENARVHKNMDEKIKQNKAKNKVKPLDHETERKFFMEVDKKYSTQEVNTILEKQNSDLLKLNSELVKQTELLQAENGSLKYKMQNVQNESKEKQKDIRNLNSKYNELNQKMNYIMKMEPSWMKVLNSKEFRDFKEKQDTQKRPSINPPKPVEEIRQKNKATKPNFPNNQNFDTVASRNDLKNKLDEDQKKTSQFDVPRKQKL